jgi:hypothetical protein
MDRHRRRRVGEKRMKTLLLTAVFVLLALYGGAFAFNIHTRHIARARMLLYLLGDRFAVQAKITPLWGIVEPIGDNVYCDRIYSVSFQVTM